MAMAEETEHDGKHQHQGARDIRRAAVVMRFAADYSNHDRQRCGRKNHAAGIDADATDPFFEIVALRLEYKPLISKKSKSYAEHIGEQAGQHIPVGKNWRQDQSKQGKAAIAKGRVTSAHRQVPDER